LQCIYIAMIGKFGHDQGQDTHQHWRWRMLIIRIGFLGDSSSNSTSTSILIGLCFVMTVYSGITVDIMMAVVVMLMILLLLLLLVFVLVRADVLMVQAVFHIFADTISMMIAILSRRLKILISTQASSYCMKARTCAKKVRNHHLKMSKIRDVVSLTI
jgi:hypothetical protein